MTTLRCHLCESETDFTCDRCGEPVCEDCCVKMTIHNQIDYPLCTLCGDVMESDRREHYQREAKAEEKVLKEKERKAAVRKTNYMKPENIEKRRIRKVERQRLQRELREKQMANAARIIGEMFRGMF